MTRNEVLAKLCLLMSRANNLAGWAHPADCICGESDERKAMWPVSMQDFQNDGVALDIMEKLIDDEIKRRDIAVNSCGVMYK